MGHWVSASLRARSYRQKKKLMISASNMINLSSNIPSLFLYNQILTNYIRASAHILAYTTHSPQILQSKMIKQPLIDKQTKKADTQKFLFTSQMSPITRYNKVIDVYNAPSFRGDEPELQRIPDSDLYEWEFRFLAKTRGKVIFGFLCLLPGIDLVVLGFSIFFALYYWSSLSTVDENSKKVLDPFKKMTFDPELCYQMGCDFYQFNIELKELSGFSLNYQENVSDRLNLKKERGKTSLLVYNATFWASYSYVSQWKISHYMPFLCSIVLCLTINILLIVLIAI